jgi:hypothetical protein
VAEFRRSAGDRLDLALVDADSGRSGNHTFAFVGSGPFTAAGQVRYAAAGPETHVFLNTDADLEAEGLIRPSGILALRKGDFVL